MIWGHSREVQGGLGFSLLVSILPERETFCGEHFLDFDQRRLAEIFARQKCLFGDTREVSKGADSHFLEAIPGPDGQFEVGDRDVEKLG